LRVVCRPTLRDGFSLAGVHAIPADDAVEAAALLPDLVDQPELGVLLVEDELFFGLPEPFRQSLERRALPVVVPFPGPRRGERPSAQAMLVELLQRAIGYRVRLR
jgi:vacuolar-type H+-ATPase subunit F/Vma7